MNKIFTIFYYIFIPSLLFILCFLTFKPFASSVAIEECRPICDIGVGPDLQYGTIINIRPTTNGCICEVFITNTKE